MTKRFEIAGVEVDAETLRQWDREHSWHPFTVMSEYFDSEPLVIARGEGSRLQDVDGKWYYDGCSSVWLNLHGHRHPAIDQAIIDQLQSIAHCTTLGQANIPATILARELIQIAPAGLNRVQFSDSGATAVEIAVKIAIQFWTHEGQPEKRQILGFTNNYHGDTLGAMAIAPSELFHKPFLDLLPVNPRLPYPACHDHPFVASGTHGEEELAATVDQYLGQHAHEVAGVIIEPVEGAGGMIPAQPGFLHQLQKVCRKHEVLLIVDEIATGFGHTGHLFACSAEDVEPDLLCVGKALTGGYLPIAATLTTEKLFNSFLGPPEAMRTLYHGHSYAGNPLGCAAAIASLKLFPAVLETLPEKVAGIAAFRDALENITIVEQVRQRGLMLGVSLDWPDSNQTESAVDGWRLRRMAFDVALVARRRGMIIRPIGNVVILLPPPSSSLEEMTEMVGILRDSIEEVAAACKG